MGERIKQVHKGTGVAGELGTDLSPLSNFASAARREFLVELPFCKAFERS